MLGRIRKLEWFPKWYLFLCHKQKNAFEYEKSCGMVQACKGMVICNFLLYQQSGLEELHSEYENNDTKIIRNNEGAWVIIHHNFFPNAFPEMISVCVISMYNENQDEKVIQQVNVFHGGIQALTHRVVLNFD